MDINKIISWGIKNWYWFLISVIVCVVVGGLYFIKKHPVFAIESSIMLRNSGTSNKQDEMLMLMGATGEKLTVDEVKVLTSSSLMEKVVDKLGLQVTCIKKGKKYWDIQYPQADIQVSMAEPILHTVKMSIKCDDGQYKVKVSGNQEKEDYVLHSLNETIKTPLGEISLHALENNIKNGDRYRIILYPKPVAVNLWSKSIKIAKLNRESNIITLSSSSPCPQRTIDAINTLVDFYNMESFEDKNLLAMQTASFLNERLKVVSEQLAAAENAEADYKRNNHIADLDAAAELYMTTGEQSQRELAEINAQLDVLDFLGQFMENNTTSLIPSTLGNSDGTLASLIGNYNSLMLTKIQTSQTASESNPVIKQLNDQIADTRANILTTITNSKSALGIRIKNIEQLENHYYDKLESVPEKSRRFLEIQRERTMLEEQYVYLVQKREENTMILNSSVVPTKIIDRAYMNPKPISPKLIQILAGSILVGLLLPFLVLFFGIFREEYLCPSKA